MTVEDQRLHDSPPATFDGVAEDAEPDPHYLELLYGTRLPQAYLPSRMPGPQKTWIRVASVALIAIFVLATACGVCLTYGPHVG